MGLAPGSSGWPHIPEHIGSILIGLDCKNEDLKLEEEPTREAGGVGQVVGGDRIKIVYSFVYNMKFLNNK